MILNFVDGNLKFLVEILAREMVRSDWYSGSADAYKGRLGELRRAV